MGKFFGGAGEICVALPLYTILPIAVARKIIKMKNKLMKGGRMRERKSKSVVSERDRAI